MIFFGKRMPPKRKGNGYLEEIRKMKKQRDEEAADCGESANTFHRPSENVFFSFKAATAAEMLRKILEQASPDDIMGEYIWFLKNLPKLLNNVESDLIEEVKTELGIANLKLSGKVNFKGSNYPILDALSCKMGKSLRHILAPPTTSCLLCGKVLRWLVVAPPLSQWSWDCFEVRLGVQRLSWSCPVLCWSSCSRLFQIFEIFQFFIGS